MRKHFAEVIPEVLSMDACSRSDHDFKAKLPLQFADTKENEEETTEGNGATQNLS